MIRAYRPADLQDVLRVWAVASAQAHAFLDPAFLAVEREKISREWLPKADTWVWEAGGRLTGFLSLIGQEVGALFVDPAAQRSGIGSALIGHARALHGELEVDVFADNPIGRAFYVRCGFEVLRSGIHPETRRGMLRLRSPAREGVVSAAGLV
ncbi:MAG: GNAT family N-acetyltransferase [Betaproteobacteria bacterium]|nr:GNAT family N-acetyltransferase [Betaproteobacteria bacterium]